MAKYFLLEKTRYGETREVARTASLRSMSELVYRELPIIERYHKNLIELDQAILNQLPIMVRGSSNFWVETVS